MGVQRVRVSRRPHDSCTDYPLRLWTETPSPKPVFRTHHEQRQPSNESPCRPRDADGQHELTILPHDCILLALGYNEGLEYEVCFGYCNIKGFLQGSSSRNVAATSNPNPSPSLRSIAGESV